MNKIFSDFFGGLYYNAVYRILDCSCEKEHAGKRLEMINIRINNGARSIQLSDRLLEEQDKYFDEKIREKEKGEIPIACVRCIKTF